MNLRFRQLTAFLCLICHLATTVLAQSPAWWTSRGVIVSGQQADDFAAMNIGQLKTFARGAWLEMEAELTGGAGDALDQLIQNWDVQASPADDYAVATLGQLKTVARPFYERLQSAGITTALPTWLASIPTSDDFSVANIGQAKTVFGFDIVPAVPLGEAGNVMSSMAAGITAAGAVDGSTVSTNALAPPGDIPGSAQGRAAQRASAAYPSGFRVATAIRSKSIGIRFIEIYPQIRSIGSQSIPVIEGPFKVTQSTDLPLNKDTDNDGRLDDGMDSNGDGDPDDPGDPRDLEPSRDYDPDDGSDTNEDGDVDEGERFYSKVTQTYTESQGEVWINDPDASPQYSPFLTVQNFTLRPSFAGTALDIQAQPYINWEKVADLGVTHAFHADEGRVVTNVEGWMWDSTIRSHSVTSVRSDRGAAIDDMEVALWCNAPAPEEQQASFLVVDMKQGSEGIKAILLGSITLIIPQGKKVATQYTFTASASYSQLLNSFKKQMTGSGKSDLMGAPNGGVAIHLRPPLSKAAGSEPFSIGVDETVTRHLVPYSLSLDPGQTSSLTDGVVVPADEASMEVSAHLFLDEMQPLQTGKPMVTGHLVKADISWSTQGGGLSTNLSAFEHDDWDVATALNIEPKAGSTHKVKATLRRLYLGNPTTGEIASDILPIECLTANIVAEAQPIVTGPGAAAVATFKGDTEMPADGKTEKEITATIKDAHGNPVAQGTQVSWHLEGDGEIVSKTLETVDTSITVGSVTSETKGLVKATVRAGRIPGEDQKLVLYADGSRHEHTIQNTKLNVTLTIGKFTSVGTKKSLLITASAAGANGTAVRWQTTRGRFTNKSSTLQGGRATATIEIDSDTGDAALGRVVVTAAVAKSMGITSVLLPSTGLELFPASTVSLTDSAQIFALTKDTPLTMQVQGSTALAGKKVVVTAEPPLITEKLPCTPPGSMGTTFPFQEYVWLFGTQRLDYDFSTEVEFTWGANWNTVEPNGSLLLTRLGDDAKKLDLRLGPDGLPFVGGRVYVPVGASSDYLERPFLLKISDAAARVVAKDSKKRRLSFAISDRQMTLSITNLGVTPNKTYTATETYPGVPWIPRVSTSPIYRLPIIQAYWRPTNLTPSGATTAATTFIQKLTLGWERPDQNNSTPLRISGTAPGQVVTLDATGKGTFTLLAPQGYLATTARLSAKLQEQTTPAIPTAKTEIPVAQTGPNLNLMLAELHTNVHFDNRNQNQGQASAEEKMELTRYAAGVTATSASALMAAPAASGGNLEHQAAQSRKLIQIAAAQAVLDDTTHKINQLDQQMDQVTLTDSKGKEWMRVNLGYSLYESAQQSSGLPGPELKENKLVTSLVEASPASRQSMVQTVKGNGIFATYRDIAHRIGSLPFAGDFALLEKQLATDGIIELFDSMKTLATAVATKPQAAATLGLSTLCNKLRAELDPWAKEGTSLARPVIVATAGLYAGLLEATALAAASGAQQDTAKRRMIGNLVGTAISAMAGDQQARDRLSEMVPFWSWVILYQQTAALWVNKQYFDSGRQSAGLLMAAAGDITIAIGVVKGVSLTMKFVQGAGGVSNALRLGVKKVGNFFKREAETPPPLPEVNDIAQRSRQLTVVVDSSVEWGGGIAKQGLPFEDWLQTSSSGIGTRCPPGFPTWDFFNQVSGKATSAKAVNCRSPSKVAKPREVYYKIKKEIDAAHNYDASITRSNFTVNPDDITSRELKVAVPPETTFAQWEQIDKAIEYGATRGVNVVIYIVR